MNEPIPIRQEALDAERAVLGSCLIDPHTIDTLAEFLQADDFIWPDHQQVFGAMLSLCERHTPCDIVTVSSALDHVPLGTPAPMLLASLSGLVPTAVHAPHYGQIVLDESRTRALWAAGDEMRHATPSTLNVHLTKLQDIMARIERRAGNRQWPSLTELIDDNEQMLLGARPDTSRVATGITTLDGFAVLMRRRKMTVLAARPSVGKTSLATTIAHHLAYAGLNVGFFSAEMEPQDILNKTLSIQLRMPYEHLTEGAKTPDEQRRIVEANIRLKTLDLEIVPAQGWTVEQIASAVRLVASKTRRPLDLVIVDYLQILDSGKRDTRNLEVGAMSIALKRLAQRENCAVLVLSQLKRSMVAGYPTLSDLRDSGTIEQDADVVVMLSMPLDAKEQDWMGATVRPVVVLVRKNRLGKTGMLALGMNTARMEYEGWSSATEPYTPSGKDKAAGMEF